MCETGSFKLRMPSGANISQRDLQFFPPKSFKVHNKNLVQFADYFVARRTMASGRNILKWFSYYGPLFTANTTGTPTPPPYFFSILSP
jgi:hypothetical protein